MRLSTLLSPAVVRQSGGVLTAASYAVLGLALLMMVAMTGPHLEVYSVANGYPAAHAAPFSDEDGSPARHAAPLQQLHDGVLPPDILCNGDRELHMLDQRPICIFPNTYESLLTRGIDGLVRMSSPQEIASLLELNHMEEAWVRDNLAVKVAYDPDWFPIEYIDESGELSGITSGYITEFERITEMDFQSVPIANWTHALQSIRDGSADVIFMIAHTPERAVYMNFTTPHYTIESRLATLDDVQLDLDQPDIRIATMRNYAIESWLDENRPDVAYTSVDSIAGGLALLQDGEVDAVADTWLSIHIAAEAAGVSVYDAGATGHSYDLAIGYRGDLPILGSILQKTLDSIPQSTLEALQNTLS